ncbi:MAG: hypothetical protein IT518_07325 [Burkholderiales bacterium]|nr:hypothetical protein [Burkholderiales bacterium]
MRRRATRWRPRPSRAATPSTSFARAARRANRRGSCARTSCAEIAIRHPAVLEVAVFGVPHERWSETPLAAVVLRREADVTAEALRDWINERVGARYQRVSAVAILAEFPRNAAGKILKRELGEPYWAGRGAQI